MKKWKTKKEREEAGQRFSVIDAHMERVKIKKEHPEHPTLTAFALSILFPKRDDEKQK
jgi:hypothetical protein